MNSGYIIRELRLTGPTTSPAFVRFQKGLNIISGPSNTGKTYIFQCINYMLGGSTAPKNIVEARNYAYCYLEIETTGGKLYILKSDLSGGDFHVYDGAIDDLKENTTFKRYNRKHSDSEEESISQFFLSLCQLTGKKLKMNVNGKKRGLSYRDLVRLALVDETNIVTDKSLIVSVQYVNQTVERSVFKLVLTGKDDSHLIEKLSTKEITHRKGKIEMLTDLIAGVDKDMAGLTVQNFEPEQLEKTESGIASLHRQLSSLDIVYTDLTNQRGEHYKELSKFTEGREELQGVLERSRILASQYSSDASRLLSTIEACELLEAIPGEIYECPVCHSGLEKEISSVDVLTVAEACKTEYTKIGLLQNELVSSQDILQRDISGLDESISTTRNFISKLSEEIEEQVQQKINSSVSNLEKLQSVNDVLKRYDLLNERRKSLVDSKNFIASTLSKKRKDDSGDNNLSSIIYPLTEQMQKILAACHYPGLTTMSFNEDKVDFIISGQDRELPGKGYRAIIYSTFVVGIQKLLATQPFSIGVPVLDSPFVTYRKPEAGQEGIPIDLAMDFYRYLATSGLDQVIIMENEEPPSDIESSVNHIVFTQSSEIGRYGFIPV